MKEKSDLEKAWLDFRNHAYNGLSKTLKIMNHKAVKSTTTFAKEVLDLTDKMKGGDVLSKTAAAVASIESVARLLNVPKPDPIADFIVDNELEESGADNLSYLLLNKAVLSRLKVELAFETEKNQLVKVCIDDKNFVYFLKAKTLDSDSSGGQDHLDLHLSDVYENYYLNKGFDISCVYTMFWDLYKNKIFLTNKKDANHGPIRGFKFDLGDIFLNNGEIERIGKEIEMCEKKGISRSYLLVGDPGLGKTTRCFAACERYCPRILKIDSSALDFFEIGDVEKHIENFMPDAIILDDIDRANSDRTNYFLFTLENIKRQFPKIVLFATANYFNRLDKAIVRPGRFDRIIWVEPPTEKERESLIRSFVSSFGISVTEPHIKAMAKGTTGFSHAYIRELIVRLANSDNHGETLKESLVEFTRTLQLDGDPDEEAIE